MRQSFKTFFSILQIMSKTLFLNLPFFLDNNFSQKHFLFTYTKNWNTFSPLWFWIQSKTEEKGNGYTKNAEKTTFEAVITYVQLNQFDKQH